MTARATSITQGRAKRWIAVVASVALTVTGVTLVSVPHAAAATPGITLAKTADDRVLAGDPISFTLTASNPTSNSAAVPEYNTSFRDVLPVGVAYTPGSTTPANIGEPTVITNPGTGQQTLIWSDTFDLQPGGIDSISFTALADDTVLPVGSTVSNTASAYASTQPRLVPKFSGTGAPIADPNVQSTTSNTTTTAITALKITKDEPSLESKLLRGVHDHPTTYTLTVDETAKGPTNNDTVTDYLPASLEFLGCGAVDNSAAVEYPGAPPLTVVPQLTSDCPTPASVDTVSNPAGFPAGIYTKVVWNIASIPASGQVVIKYQAGIPLKQNALFASPPTPASGDQAANLDNNTGPSTRQNGPAAAITNFAVAGGTYTGNVAGGQPPQVSADTSHTVTDNDLRIHKTVAPDAFAAGGIATYTLTVQTSEYVDNAGISITDTLPNGICPLSSTTNFTSGAPAECAPVPGTDPVADNQTINYQNVTQNADGTFTIVFSPIAVAKDGTTTITYQGRMRSTFTGGSLVGTPTAAGDSFTNNIVETGTSTPVPNTGETGPLPVTDPTSATQTSGVGTLTKTILPRATPMDCNTGTYGKTDPTFVKGDRVCFQVAATFSAANQTRNPVLTDFLPDNLSYENGSVTFPSTDPNAIPAGQIVFANDNGALTWTLGTSNPDGSKTVAPGAVFLAQFSAIVLQAAVGPAPDKPGNIVKLRSENSSGVATSLRDGVDFQVAAAPPLGITKGVASVDSPANGPNGPNVDGVTVREGSTVTYRIDLTNNGSLANANNVPVNNIKVWDVLPPGISCTDVVTPIPAGGTCTDPGDGGQPSFAGNDHLSAITWTVPSTLAAGDTAELTYQVTIPSGVSVSANLVNNASVRSYDSTTDLGTPQTYFPANNVDTTVDPADEDAPAATDPSNVVLPNVALTKGVTSSINEANNVGLEATPQPSTQATIGETTTFTVRATVPAGSSTFNGVFTDPLPAGLQLVSATAGFLADASSAGAPAALPGGFTFNPTAPSITFPASYDNTTATDQAFVMTIVARVTDVTGNLTQHAAVNTGSFASDTALTGGTALPARTAAATTNIRVPAPTLTKSNDAPVAGVSAGDTVTYTLVAGDATGRPPLHDGWVLDCLPTGLTFTAYGTPPGGVTTVPAVAGDGSNGCPTGSELLSWNVGTLAPAATVTLTYTATVDPTATGKQQFVNNAAVSGNSLAGARISPLDHGATDGHLFSTPASSTVTAAGASLTKTVTPTIATVGQTVTYTVTGQLPPGINFDNLALIDQLPAGVDPASATLVSTTCEFADTTACSVGTAVPLTSAPGVATGSTLIGWHYGNVAQNAQARTIAVVYTAKIADVAAATRGATLTNTAHIAWDNTPSTPPTSAGATFDQSSDTANAAVTVQEPVLAIDKTVTDTTPAPGSSFTYHLSVSNSGAANVSAAFNVTVSDAVPTGVVVDPATISDGGTLSGADATTGGGTISWTLPGSLAAGATHPDLTYSARLAPSSTLTAAALTNTARIPGYDSLASGGRHYTGPSDTAAVTPDFPRLSTVKTTPDGTTAFLGEPFHWQITVTSSGASPAFHPSSTDTLPANWTYDANSTQVSVNGGPPTDLEPTTSTAGGVQTLTWADLAPTLAVGTSLTIDFTATPGPGVIATPGIGLSVNQTNSATSVAQDATGATSNAVGPYSAGPGTRSAHIASADVSLTKTVGNRPTAGGTGSWNITVTNHGPDPATGPFTVTDGFDNPLPTGVSIVSASGPGWSCTTGVPIACARTNPADTLANAASFPAISIVYAVDSAVGDGTALANTASVSAHTHDPVPANNSDTANTTVSANADLVLTKQVTSPQVVAGSTISYAISTHNLGPSSAIGAVVVTDALPAGLTFVSAGGTGWTCATIAPGTIGATLSCTLGDGTDSLGAGSVAPDILVTLGVPADQTANIVNTASVTSPTTDPTPANNHDTVSTPVDASADLAIQKQHGGAGFTAGDPGTYTVQVQNIGPSVATGVTVTDTLPANLSFVSISSADPNWTCAAGTGQAVNCTYGGTLDVGTSSFTMNVLASPSFSGNAHNVIAVASSTPDPVASNNTAFDDSTVNTEADLEITKTHLGTPVAGGPLSYQLDVHNNGPSDATNVTVTDPLPVGVTYLADSGGCTGPDTNRVLTCTIASLAAGDSTTISVNVTIDSDVGPTSLSNTAAVQSDTFDPNLDNNNSTDTIQVTTTSALTLTKSLATPTPVLVGRNAVFDLAVSNAGPSDATNVVVTDALPSRLHFVSATGAGWACAPSGQNVICVIDTVPAGPTPVTLQITTLVDSGTPVSLPSGTATLQNTATVDASTPGSRMNPPAVNVPVQAEADLAVVKTVSSPASGTAAAGGQVTWSIAVTDSGPSDASGPITVTDALPAFETFVSAAGPWSCTAGPAPNPPGPTAHQSITCTSPGPLPAGASVAPLLVTVQLDPATPAGAVANTATATSPTPGDPGTGTGNLTVAKSAMLSLTKTHTGTATIGSPLTFTLRAHNAGPSIADQVVITDPLPTGLTYKSATGTGWTCTAAANVVTCDLAGTLAVGADAAPLALVTTVGATAYPSVRNVATVSSTDPDIPNTDDAADPVTVAPDTVLTVTKKHIGTLAVGSTGTYQLTITDHGPTATPGPVTVTDALPAGLTYKSASGTGWTCSATGSTVTCTNPGVLAVGASLTLTLTVSVGAAAYPSVTNTAQVSAPGAAPVSGSDTGSVVPLVTLSEAKSLQSYTGGVATYQIAVTNHGPNATVSALRITDPLPTGLSLQKASGTGFSCLLSGDTATCVHGAGIAAGATVTVTVVATVTGTIGTTVINKATANGGGDPGSAVLAEAVSNPVPLVVSISGNGTGPNNDQVGQLPDTGANIVGPLWTALALLIIGLGLMVLARRRRS